MANTIYYLLRKVYEDGSKTYYLANINAWVRRDDDWSLKRFYLKSDAESKKAYYEQFEKLHATRCKKDMEAIYEVVAEVKKNDK